MNALIVGSGVTGLAVARALANRGWSSTLVDDSAEALDRNSDELADLGVTVARGGNARGSASADELVHAADLVVPSPGVPPRHPVLVAAAASTTPIRSEIDLAAETADAAGRPTLVAVTGTNGKTTVTSLVASMLVRSGRAAAAAGNIGRPLIEAVDDPELEVAVAEVSSFQLQYTTSFRPRVAVFLNIAEDHLDWHSDFVSYAAAKSRVFARQGPDDVLVHNADDPVVRRLVERARSRCVPFSVRTHTQGTWSVASDGIVTPDGDVLVALEALGRAGPHDLANALAASAAATEMGADPTAIADELREFRGFPHRVELVGEAGGVSYVDDSKATNPHAARSALDAYRSAVLVAGGRNKGLDLGVLSTADPLPRAVVGFGEAGDEVVAAFRGARVERTGVETVRVDTMEEAVSAAAALAHVGDTVLLSPGCASFDAYANYAERGDHFAALVAALPGFSPSRGVSDGHDD